MKLLMTLIVCRNDVKPLKKRTAKIWYDINYEEKNEKRANHIFDLIMKYEYCKWKDQFQKGTDSVTEAGCSDEVYTFKK